jgi:hypothetical protein
MAKKNSRSQPDDSSPTTPPAPAPPAKPRRRRASGPGSDPQPSATAAESSTSAAISTSAANSTPQGTGDPYSADASRAASRSDSTRSGPTEEAIRMRAYQRYLERGGGHGMAFDDWLAAERELNGR